MLISHKHKFIFTKTVKTAGTSVEIYFEPYCMAPQEWQCLHGRDEYESEYGVIGFRGKNQGSQKWWAHMPAISIRDLVGDESWNSYFKFTIIRNPFDKLISGWYHFIKPEISIYEKIQFLLRNPSSLKFLKIKKFDIPLFRNWICSGGKIKDRDKYLIGDLECVDFFIRYEALAEDIQKVCGILSFPWEPARIGAFKKGHRIESIKLTEFYNEKTRKIVASEYAWELKRFGYSFPIS
jgi:hypothetical protein